jgi:hypothetical protein
MRREGKGREGKGRAATPRLPEREAVRQRQRILCYDESVDTVLCRDCGFEVKAGQWQCPFCGSSLGAQATGRAKFRLIVSVLWLVFLFLGYAMLRD